MSRAPLPPELTAALRDYGWLPDGADGLFCRGELLVWCEPEAYHIGVRAHGIQPAVKRAVPYEAALAWVRRDLDAFTRLANRHKR